MIVKLLTEHYLEFLSLIGGCRGSTESTHVKRPHCWKSHALTQIFIFEGPLYGYQQVHRNINSLVPSPMSSSNSSSSEAGAHLTREMCSQV